MLESAAVRRARFAVSYLDCDHFKVVTTARAYDRRPTFNANASRLESASVPTTGPDGSGVMNLLCCCVKTATKPGSSRLQPYLEVFQTFLLVNRKKINVSIASGLLTGWRIMTSQKYPEGCRYCHVLRQVGGETAMNFTSKECGKRSFFKLDVEHDLGECTGKETNLNCITSQSFLLKDLQVTGFEALIRWRHPSRG